MDNLAREFAFARKFANEKKLKNQMVILMVARVFQKNEVSNTLLWIDRD